MNEQRFAEKILKFCDVTAFLIGVMALWKIDIAVSALLTDVALTNGFATFTPSETFHLGVWSVIGSLVWLMLRSIGVTRVNNDV